MEPIMVNATHEVLIAVGYTVIGVFLCTLCFIGGIVLGIYVDTMRLRKGEVDDV